MLTVLALQAEELMEVQAQKPTKNRMTSARHELAE